MRKAWASLWVCASVTAPRPVPPNRAQTARKYPCENAIPSNIPARGPESKRSQASARTALPYFGIADPLANSCRANSCRGLSKTGQ